MKRAEMTALRAEAAELHAQLGALEQYAGPTRRDVALDDYLAGTLHYLDAAANAPGESAPLVQAMREAARVVGTVRERAATRGALPRGTTRREYDAVHALQRALRRAEERGAKGAAAWEAAWFEAYEAARVVVDATVDRWVGGETREGGARGTSKL